jgi:hypothetical protein
MADWQVTATTIYCDAVDDEVTLMVFADGTVKCTGEQRYSKPDKETSKEMKDKSRRLGKVIECQGLECIRVTEFKDGLLGKK